MSNKIAKDREPPAPVQKQPDGAGNADHPLQTGETPATELPRDVGWLLLMGGMIGFVAPGILGLDMLALGTLILWPGNQQRIERWLNGHPSTPKPLRGSMKQVNRFLESLESRYPPRHGKN